LSNFEFIYFCDPGTWWLLVHIILIFRSRLYSGWIQGSAVHGAVWVWGHDTS